MEISNNYEKKSFDSLVSALRHKVYITNSASFK